MTHFHMVHHEREVMESIENVLMVAEGKKHSVTSGIASGLESFHLSDITRLHTTPKETITETTLEDIAKGTAVRT